MIRRNDTGVALTLYTTDNDLTDGLEGFGQTLAEALFDLADSVIPTEGQ